VKQINRETLNPMPSDIAAIGRELSRAIRDDHRRRNVRRSRVRRAVVVVAVMGVGSGTALAAKLAVAPGNVLNPCIAHAVTTPGLYHSLQQMNLACGLPSAPPSASPSPPATQPNASSTAVHHSRTTDMPRVHPPAKSPQQHMAPARPASTSSRLGLSYLSGTSAMKRRRISSKIASASGGVKAGDRARQMKSNG
jgi:hypothetical protein